MRRIDAVRALGELVEPDDLFVTSIGAVADDWWNHRPGGVDNTFFTGILGSVSSTACGLALALPHRRVVALETDGSVLMNVGVLCTIATARPQNLTILVFDNGIYESIGGAPSLTAGDADLALIARGAGFRSGGSTDDVASLPEMLEESLHDSEPGFVVALIEAGHHPWPADKAKPTDGVEDKYRFLRYVEALEGIVIHPGAARN